MKYIYYILITLLCATYAHADSGKPSNIKGAFGVDFYSILTEEELKKCSNNQYCPITPSNPYIVFSSYSVQLSPFKKKVFEINGSGDLTSHNDCVAHAEKILKALNKKYNIQLEKFENQYPNGVLLTSWSTYIGTRPKGIWALSSDNDRRKYISLQCRDHSQSKSSGNLNKIFPSLNLSDHTISITYRNYAVLANEKPEGMIDETGL